MTNIRLCLAAAVLVLSPAGPGCSDESEPVADGRVDTRAVGDGPRADGARADSASASADSGLVPLSGPHAQVIVPVADLRNQRVPAKPGDYSIDMAQETQVLYGDLLAVSEENGDWFKVSVLKQLTYDDASSTFKPYPGWIQKKSVKSVTAYAPPDLVVSAQTTSLRETSATGSKVLFTLSVGTLLASSGATASSGLRPVRRPEGGTAWVSAQDVQALPAGTPTVSRATTLSRAGRFVGATYFWGGFSAPQGSAYALASTGVDCSGLTALTYRSLGVFLPRNSDDQRRYTEAVALKDLVRGDLLFVSSSTGAQGVSHVMLFDGDEKFVESTPAGSGVVRWSTFSSSFGMTRSELDQQGGKVSAQKYVLASRVKGVTWAQ